MKNLGKKARDKITGFEGIITGETTNLYGSPMYCITPALLPHETCEKRRREWFPVDSVEIIDKEEIAAVAFADKLSPDRNLNTLLESNVNQIARRSEQENRIEKFLFDLLGVGRKYLSVFFKGSEIDERKDSKPGTSVRRIGNSIHLLLAEPISNDDLDKWGEAIVKAEELLGIIEKEQVHEMSNPSFFKAMQAKYEFRYR